MAMGIDRTRTGTSITLLCTDETAQVAGVFVFILAIVVFSFIYIVFGYMTDSIIDMNNDMMGSLHYSQQYADTMDIFFHYWYALPIIVVIVCIAWLIKNAISERSGVVE